MTSGSRVCTKRWLLMRYGIGVAEPWGLLFHLGTVYLRPTRNAYL